MENEYTETIALLECNDINCKHRWEEPVNENRVIGNRLIGLEFCPKCHRFDSPYVLATEL